MKTLLTTLAAASFVLVMNACTKAPMPSPEQSASVSQSARITQPPKQEKMRPITELDTFRPGGQPIL